MSEALNFVNQAIDEEHSEKSAHTRRKMIKGAGAVIGGMGLMGIASGDALGQSLKNSPNTPGEHHHRGRDGRGARDDRQHGRLRARAAGRASPSRTSPPRRSRRRSTTRSSSPMRSAARPPRSGSGSRTRCSRARRTSSRRSSWAIRSSSTPTSSASRRSRAPASSPGRASRATRRSSWARRPCTARSPCSRWASSATTACSCASAAARRPPGLPTTGSNGFYDIRQAVSQLEAAGFGFGKEGSKAGQFYEYDEVSKRTPDPGFPAVNTRKPV